MGRGSGGARPHSSGGDETDRSDTDILVDVDPEIGPGPVPSERSVRLLLDDILEATERIGHCVMGLDQPGFLADEKTSDAVVRNLAILWQAAAHVPEDVTARTRSPKRR